MDKLSLGGANMKSGPMYSADIDEIIVTGSRGGGAPGSTDLLDRMSAAGGTYEGFAETQEYIVTAQRPAGDPDAVTDGEEIIVTAQRGPDVSVSIDLVDLIRLYREISAAAQANQRAVNTLFMQSKPWKFANGIRLAETTNNLVFVDTNGDKQYDLVFRTDPNTGLSYVSNNARDWSLTDNVPQVSGSDVTILLG
jgi:hypothetical protein